MNPVPACEEVLRILEVDSGAPRPINHHHWPVCTASEYAKCLHFCHLLWASPRDCVELSLSGLQKDEPDRQNSEHSITASSLPLRQPLTQPEKKDSSTGSDDFEGESQIRVLALTRNPQERGSYPDDQTPLDFELR